MMKKWILLMFLAIFITGCIENAGKRVVEEKNGSMSDNQSNIAPLQGKAQEEKLKEKIEEKQPEETAEESPSCTDECSADSCLGNKYIECATQQDGCKRPVDKGIREGKCLVKCFFSSDCSTEQDCLFYECRAKKEGLDLTNLPSPFTTDSLIVVGSGAPSTDVLAAIDIASMLLSKTGKKVSAVLDNEVVGNEADYNLILIGIPCDNKAIEKVFGIVCNGTKLNAGEAIIKLADNNSKAAMLITGKTPSDTLGAARRLAQYTNYNFTGTEVLVKLK